MRFLIFDTETTGLPNHPDSPLDKQPRIIEWAGIVYDNITDRIVDQLDILIDPRQKLEPIITKITGLEDDDLIGQPFFNEAVDQIRAMFIKADVMIAHNLPFDRAMMEYELKRIDMLDNWTWPPLHVCTVQEHESEWGRRPKLTELYESYTGNKLDQTHRALDDVKALMTVCDHAGVFTDYD